jgi:hypothetical protein
MATDFMVPPDQGQQAFHQPDDAQHDAGTDCAFASPAHHPGVEQAAGLHEAVRAATEAVVQAELKQPARSALGRQELVAVDEEAHQVEELRR